MSHSLYNFTKTNYVVFNRLEYVKLMNNKLCCSLIELECIENRLKQIVLFLKLTSIGYNSMQINYVVFIKVQYVELVVSKFRCILIGFTVFNRYRNMMCQS